MQQPQVRTIALHAASVLGGAYAALAFASSHAVDLYALVDQLNVVVSDVMKFIAMVTPIAAGAWATYKDRTRGKILDVIAADPENKVVSPKNADIPSPRVTATTAELPK